MALWAAYTLHDVKALQYHPPFFQQNDAMAKRVVSELANDINTMVGRHPSDFKLYRIGGYDDLHGVFHPAAIMEHIVDIVALINPPAPAPLFEPDPVLVKQETQKMAQRILDSIESAA